MVLAADRAFRRAGGRPRRHGAYGIAAPQGSRCGRECSCCRRARARRLGWPCRHRTAPCGPAPRHVRLVRRRCWTARRTCARICSRTYQEPTCVGGTRVPLPAAAVTHVAVPAVPSPDRVSVDAAPSDREVGADEASTAVVSARLIQTCAACVENCLACARKRDVVKGVADSSTPTSHLSKLRCHLVFIRPPSPSLFPPHYPQARPPAGPEREAFSVRRFGLYAFSKIEITVADAWGQTEVKEGKRQENRQNVTRLSSRAGRPLKGCHRMKLLKLDR
ncbi:hypothetical protein B0H13DRAFT_2010914 [Mycena leptocephala]|nr:hypothetical protein B0H13DRAFT_2010914 [Mycena leptocephala]